MVTVCSANVPKNVAFAGRKATFRDGACRCRPGNCRCRPGKANRAGYRSIRSLPKRPLRFGHAGVDYTRLCPDQAQVRLRARGRRLPRKRPGEPSFPRGERRPCATGPRERRLPPYPAAPEPLEMAANAPDPLAGLLPDADPLELPPAVVAVPADPIVAPARFAEDPSLAESTLPASPTPVASEAPAVPRFAEPPLLVMREASPPPVLRRSQIGRAHV